MKSVISWASADSTPLESQDSNCVILEGFVHASTEIRLGSLKRVLPGKQETDAGEIVEAAFQEMKPGPDKHYMCQLMRALLDDDACTFPQCCEPYGALGKPILV